MVSELNVLNGMFYKREMFQPKYHWIEIKYVGCRPELERILLYINSQVLTNHVDKIVEFNALDLVV